MRDAKSSVEIHCPLWLLMLLATWVSAVMIAVGIMGIITRSSTRQLTEVSGQLDSTRASQRDALEKMYHAQEEIEDKVLAVEASYNVKLWESEKRYEELKASCTGVKK